MQLCDVSYVTICIIVDHIMWYYCTNFSLKNAKICIMWKAGCNYATNVTQQYLVSKTNTSQQFQKNIKQNIMRRSASWEIQDMDWSKTRNEFVIFRFYYKIIIRLTNYIKYAVSYLRSIVTSYERNSHPSRQQLTRSDLCGSVWVLRQKERRPTENIKEKA